MSGTESLAELERSSSTRSPATRRMLGVPRRSADTTNEMGVFAQAFAELVRHAGTMFRLVTYDAGAASVDNARLVVEHGKDDLSRLKDESHRRLQLISELLIHEPVAAFTIDVHSNTKSTVRTVRLMSVRQRERSLLWPCAGALGRRGRRPPHARCRLR